MVQLLLVYLLIGCLISVCYVSLTILMKIKTKWIFRDIFILTVFWIIMMPYTVYHFSRKS